MNAIGSLTRQVTRPVAKYTQGTLTRGLQSMTHHNIPPPQGGMRKAWQTLQEESWVTTQGFLKPTPHETFHTTLTETRSILGSRNLGLFEEQARSDDIQTSIGALLKGFKN
ncbi:uncharacterized protein [Argopecten irradians]|uniref:uncharacterized protein n=1 Tax=Argopecten irradians TaxID=31199 RepID=UPI003711EEC6